MEPKDFIPLASPDILQEDIDQVVAVLKSGKLVQGERVKILEDSIAQYLGVKHCIAVANGTASLHLILIALGIRPGDEVILPAFSYIATANVVELVGAKPVFLDIELGTFNIDPNKIEEKITARTKAVIIVHEFGLCADTEKIKELCDQKNLLLIEDAACALGAKEGKILAGSTGIAGSFSFHPRKAITSGEGGLISTNDQKLARRLMALRNHGIEAGSNNNFAYAGFNYRMTDFQAAMLSSQLKRIDEILAKKSQTAAYYLSHISNPSVSLPRIPKNKTHAWQTFHLLLDASKNQNTVINTLYQRGVGANYGAQCMPAQTYFQKKYQSDSSVEFPNALRAYTHGLAIPLYEKLTNDNVSHIVNTINEI